MMHTEKPLHIAFGHSAAFAIRQALTQLNRAEQVAMFPDDLGFGPINSTQSARVEFYTDVMLFEPDLRVEEELAVFWRDVEANPEAQVAWFSRRCVQEYAGFLAYLSHRDSPPQYVDVAEIGARCVAHIPADRFIESNLSSRVRQQSATAYAAERRLWDQLVQENSPLRVLTSSGLVSAPISYFDDDIRACVTKDWQKGARVLGDSSYRVNSGEFSQTSDSFLWFRLRHMMEEEFDTEGDTALMRECRVRVKRPR